MPTTRNIIIFTSIAAVFVLIYVFFFRTPAVTDTALVTTPGVSVPIGDAAVPGSTQAAPEPEIAADFLELLLNVKNIRLDDAIFFETAWVNLKDSSIVLVPDGTEGRANPFAPFGSDAPTPTSTAAPLPAPSPLPQTPVTNPASPATSSPAATQ